MPEHTDVTAAVRGMVEAAGLPLSEEELAGFIEAYPLLRAGADSLYIEEVRYEEPALLFTPIPPTKSDA
jgi:hypothetical protein